MAFQIPDIDLSLLTNDALTSFAAQAVQAKNDIIAGQTPDSITQAQLDEAKALNEFATVTIPAARAERDRKAREFSSLATEEKVAEAEAEAVPEAPADTEFAAKAKTVRVANLGGVQDVEDVATVDERKTTMSFHAAPGGRFATDSEITTKDIAETLIRRNAGYQVRAVPGSGDLLATIKRSYPQEFHLGEGLADEFYQKQLEYVSSESRLEGGSLVKSTKIAQDRLIAQGEDNSLVAAGGWCSPSETDYSICFQGTTDGLWSGPEITVNRGGVRHTTGLEWSTVYGGGNLATAAGTFPTGFFNLTEAQVAAGSPTKTCVQVPCPSFTDDRLGVTGICITSPILTNRAYPEAVDVFIRGAMVVHAHQLNALQIAAMVAGSTAVTISGNPWAADGSVTSNLLGSVGMAIVDMKYRLRLQRGATLEVVLPYWVLEQMRADLSRRLGYEMAALGIADSMITSWFAQRGARVQFVYDWQDAASVAAGPTNLPGLATPITNLPTSVQFLVYPAGTWVRAVEDVITLNSVYDSTLLATNMVTQLFTEEGWTMLKMCPVSRVYTVPICPSGQTTAGALVGCVTP